MLLYEFPFLWEGENKVQKERGQQHPGDNIAPVDFQIENIEFSRDMERIRDE